MELLFFFENWKILHIGKCALVCYRGFHCMQLLQFTNFVPATPNRHNDYMCHKKLLRAGDRDGEKCLAAHNYYRCLHGVEDLEYDRKLEDSAQLYAETYPIRPSEVGKLSFLLVCEPQNQRSASIKLRLS